MLHRWKTILTVAGLAVGLQAATASAALVESNFDTDDEGWVAQEGITLTPTHHATGGDPDGYIDAFEIPGVSGIRWWEAPQSYTDELVNNIGGTFSFSLRNTQGNPANNVSQMIRIASTSEHVSEKGLMSIASSSSLTENTGEPDDTEWTRYSFDFSHDAGWLLVEPSLGYPAPTEAQFLDVLENATAIQIRAEWGFGAENAHLDSVSFSPAVVPEPASLVLLGMGALCLARRRCRR